MEYKGNSTYRKVNEKGLNIGTRYEVIWFIKSVAKLF